MPKTYFDPECNECGSPITQHQLDVPCDECGGHFHDDCLADHTAENHVEEEDEDDDT